MRVLIAMLIVERPEKINNIIDYGVKGFHCHLPSHAVLCRTVAMPCQCREEKSVDIMTACAQRYANFSVLAQKTRQNQNAPRSGVSPLIVSRQRTSDGGTPTHSSGTPCCNISSFDTACTSQTV